MKVILAEAFGMCFGVRDALRRTDEIESPQETTIHGQLVHNDVVLHQLEVRGFRQTSEHDRKDPPDTPAVLITAHGVSDDRRQRLADAGKQVIDTTCPLVRRVHQSAQRLAGEGFHVLVLGKPGHVEVQGVVEDLQSFDVVDSDEQVRTYPYARLGIICQTTLSPHRVQELRREIWRNNRHAEICFVDTICEPTRRRQQAMLKLMAEVEAVVVVGGRDSNNTLELVSLCRRHDVPVLHVQSAVELDASWLARFAVIGLTAGTSTLGSTVAEVYEVLVGSEK